MLIAILMMSVLILSGCQKEVAILSVSTTDGFTGTYEAYNTNLPFLPTASEKAADHPVQIKLSSEGTAHIHFYCPVCDYTVEFDEVSPYSGVLSCECSENTNYIAIQLFAKYMIE